MIYKRMETEKNVENPRAIIVCEEGALFWKKERRFLCRSSIAGKFYNWLELPGLSLVTQRTSFQLDSWYGEAMRLAAQ